MSVEFRSRERAMWHATVLDIAACDRLEIVCALAPHEQAQITPQSWPAEVREGMRRIVKEWFAEHWDRAAVAFTSGLAKGEAGMSCVVIVHHMPRHVPAVRENQERTP